MEDNMHADTAPPVNCRMFPTSRLMNLIICRARIRCKSRLKYRCTQHARPHVPERAEVNMEDNMRVDIAPPYSNYGMFPNSSLYKRKFLFTFSFSFCRA